MQRARTRTPPLQPRRSMAHATTAHDPCRLLPYHTMGVLPSTQPVATLGSSFTIPYHTIPRPLPSKRSMVPLQHFFITPSVNYGIGHTHHIVLRLHQHLPLGGIPRSHIGHPRILFHQKGRNGLQRIATTGERRYRSAKRFLFGSMFSTREQLKLNKIPISAHPNVNFQIITKNILPEW